MALAVLRLDDAGPDRLVLEIDTGTSPLYRIHLGKEVRRDQGFPRLGEVRWSSPVLRNPAAGRHVQTGTRQVLDPALVTERGLWVQVESMRDTAGNGPAWSRPVRILRGAPLAEGTGPPDWPEPAMSAPFALPDETGSVSSDRVRTVAVRSARETFSRPASLGDLVTAVARVAGPVVAELLRSPPANGSAPGGADRPATGTEQSAVTIAALLRTLLGALTRDDATVATSSSLSGAASGNRLVGPETSRPFIAGIDDALIAALAGPVIASVVGPLVSALPQLLNATNQRRLDQQRESHRHVAEILAQVDRSRLLEQLLAAQRAGAGDGSAGAGTPGPGGAAADPALDREALQALIGLLQSDARTVGPVGTPEPGEAGSTAQSLSAPARDARPSRAVLGMVTEPALPWQGGSAVLFARGRALTLRFRVDVPAGGPAAPIPRAALRVTLREPGGARDLLVHTERLPDLRPGEVRSVTLPAERLAALPCHTDLEVTAALRWPSSTGARQATCVQRLVLACPQQVVATGAGGPARELVDMGRFRSFWHKVWASPASDDGGKGPLWGLDVALRYSVVTTPEADNALMETRIQAVEDSSGLRASTTGRAKSGIELSLAQLNSLLSLWPDEQPLDSATLEAFAARRHLAAQGGDVVHRVRLQGRRGTRGLLWVVPVPTLRTFTVARVVETDAFGQVTAMEPREVRFPVVEAVRVLGLVSDDSPAETTAEGYRFEGYQVRLDELVALEPAVPASTRGGGD